MDGYTDAATPPIDSPEVSFLGRSVRFWKCFFFFLSQCFKWDKITTVLLTCVRASECVMGCIGESAYQRDGLGRKIE